MNTSLPKIIHQIWIGPNKLPENCKAYIEKIERLHPEYKHMLWTNDNIPCLPDLVKKQFDRYGNIKRYAFQADILRYYLINDYGGIYIDIDFEIKKNISPLLTKEFNIALPPFNPSKIHWVCNSFFASIQKNFVLEDILNNLKDEIYHGPIFFASKIKKFLNLQMDKTTLSVDIYNACLNNKYINCIDSKAVFNEYGHHHALKSWINNDNRKI
jgi:mannosyltransferase OCH1-like enzyme